jgi:hypothetical protein
VALYVPRQACIAAPSLGPVGVAALEVFGHYRVDARAGALQGGCRYLVLTLRARKAPAAPAGWEPVATIQRPTERGEITAIYRRQAATDTR